jgi:hypothetical protein
MPPGPLDLLAHRYAAGREGRRCRCPAAHGGPKCLAHARGYGPRGPQNGMFRHGRRSLEAKARRAEVRGWIRDAKEFLADAYRIAGVKRKTPPRRSYVSVEKALAKLLVAGKVTDPFKTVAELKAGKSVSELMRQPADAVAKPGAATAKPAATLPDDDVPPWER